MGERNIIRCTPNEITVKGEGIEYTINRSAMIITGNKIESKKRDKIIEISEKLSRIDNFTRVYKKI